MTPFCSIAPSPVRFSSEFVCIFFAILYSQFNMFKLLRSTGQLSTIAKALFFQE